MAIATDVDLITSALWAQGDIRDPLGVWGARKGVTGDASSGEIKVAINQVAEQAAAYIYTAYGATIVQLTGAITNTGAVCRLLTGWPNVDPLAGVQGFATYINRDFNGSTAFTAPQAGPRTPLITEAERFMLLFDPRPSAGVLTIMELKLGFNTDLATYSFEAYGYYWDRSVLNAPGGPRHPGAS